MIRFAALLLCLFAHSAHADITTNLERWYRFEGNGNDSSGNARNATANGTITYGAGKLGQAATALDNTNNYSLAPTELQSDTTTTIAFWAKRDSYALSPCAVSWGNGGASSTTAYYPHDNSGGNGLRWFTKSVTLVDRNDGVPPTGEWVFFCFRGIATNSGVADMFVPSTNTWSQSTTSSNPTHHSTISAGRVGTLSFASQPLGGDIDELRIYSRNLSDADVIELMQYGLQPPRIHLYRQRRQ